MSILTANIQGGFNAQKAAGLTIPAPILDAQADALKVRRKIDELSSTRHSAIDAIAAALLEDRDPATDPEIIRTVTVRGILSIGLEPVAEAAEQRVATVIRDSYSALVDEWRSAVDKAGDALTKAHAVLGDVDLDRDAQQILDKGGDIAQHYIAARDANAQCREILTAMYMFGTAAHLPTPPNPKTLTFVPATLDEYERHELGRNRSAWDLVSAGLTLRLSTPTEVSQRVASYQTERDARQRRAWEIESGVAARRQDFQRMQAAR